MSKIYQGDIFDFVASLGYTNIGIARGIEKEKKGEKRLTVYTISKIRNKARNGIKELNADWWYNYFICGYLDRIINKDYALYKGIEGSETKEIIKVKKEDRLFKYVKDFVNENDFEFEGKENAKELKEYIVLMFTEGLANYRKPKEGKTKAKNIRGQNISKNEYFIGRKEIVEEIHSVLLKDNVVVLRGIGGIGKTLIANAYACEYDKKYGCRQIITCKKSFTSYKQLLLELQLSGAKEDKIAEDEKLNERINIIKNTNKKTLLIFDNVDEFLDDNNIINNLLPDLKNTHLIFTSRLPQGAIRAKTINVDVLPYEQQIDLFETHAGEKITDRRDMEYANKILNKIGGHTFLIELAAKSVSAACYNYKKIYDYLNREDLINIPQITAEKDGIRIQNQLKDIVKTLIFDINPLEDIQKETLRLMSFFPREGIPKKIFGILFGEYIVSLNNLYGRGWIKETSIDGVSYVGIHPVICDVIKDNFDLTYGTSKFIVARIYGNISENLVEVFKEDICKLIVSTIEAINFAEEKFTEEETLQLDKLTQFLDDNCKHNGALKISKIAQDVYKAME